MILNYAFLLLLSINLAISSSTNTSIANLETEKLKNASFAPVQPIDDQKEYKTDKEGQRILTRKIAPTGLNTTTNNEETNKNKTAPSFKIVTEGSGVSKVSVGKDAVQNDKVLVVSTKIQPSSTQAPTIANSTQIHNKDAPSLKNVTVKSTSIPANKTSSTIKTSKTPTTTTSTSTSTTTSTTTTTTTTTTSTTPKPKKPKVTYSVEDMPEIAKIVPDRASNSKFPSESKSSSPKLSVDEPEPPYAQPSQELDGGLYRNHRDYIIPIVSIIFAVPILMGMVIVAYRRFRDFWSTRHYRRMDFLVDGMYND